MSTTVTPHFDLPLKIGPLGANVVEQDSTDDVGSCVVIIVSVPFGWRDEAPEFGIEDPTMRRQPIGVPAIQQVIGSQEPRAVLIIDEHPDMYDELIDVINIGVSTVKASMSSYSYISYPIETSPQDLLDEMIACIKSKAPSWVDNDANLDVWIMQIVASQAGDLRTLASDVPDTIFRYFGNTLLGLAPVDDIPAACSSTWTMRDNAGYTVPAGTFVTIRDDAGNDFAFQTEVDVVIFAGSTTAGSVRLVATQPGLAGSGLGSPGGPVNLLDTLDFVASITQDDVTSGGSDAETASDYNDRLARHLRRLSTRPILPVDFETLALDIPGVYRAIAIDLYNPADHTSNNPRMVTLSCIDELGNNLDGATRALIDATVQANREVNFICSMMDPNRSNIDVTYNAISVPSYDAPSVQSAINTAIAAYLDPANWGRDPQYTDASAAQTWVQADKVYYFEMAQLISNVEGVSRLVSLSMGIHGGSMASADVALTTPATLDILRDAYGNGDLMALPYTPDTVAARLYDALEPIQGSDPDTGYHLLIYTSGLALPMEEVSDLAETGPNGEVGWSIIVDINRVPDKALGWLAQFVGVKLNPDLDADDQRDRIRTTDGWNRGTPSAVAGAAAQYLTGAKQVVMRERYSPGVGPDPYHLQIWTVASQTPDPTAALNAIMAQKPAGLILHYSTMAGQDFQKLYTDQAHFQQVYTTYPTMQDVYLDTA